MMDEWFQNPAFMGAVGLFIGSAMGSFLNVCAHRIPLGLSIIIPASNCPECESKIPWFQNIPVISWLLLKGRARCCSFRIPPRYLLIEVFTALIFCYLFVRMAYTNDYAYGFTGCIFGWILIAVIVIDAETMTIPDRFSMGGAIIGFVLSICFPSIHSIYGVLPFIRWEAGVESLIGILIGSAFLYWIGALAGRAFGKEALGEGDVKLLGCIGAFCGWQGAVFIIFAGATLGSLFLLPVLIFHSLRRESESKKSESHLSWGQEVPFGPFLALAAMLYFGGINSWVEPWISSVFQQVYTSIGR